MPDRSATAGSGAPVLSSTTDLVGDARVRVDVDVREPEPGMLLRQHLRRTEPERPRRIDLVVGTHARTAPRDEQHRQRAHGGLAAQRVREPHRRKEPHERGVVEIGPPGGAAFQQSTTPASRGSDPQTSAASRAKVSGSAGSSA